MHRTWIYLLVFAGLLQSCQKSPLADCFKSTGNIVTEERQVANFNRILLRHNVNLHLRQALQNKITVSAGSNLMGKIGTLVNDNGQLEIRNDNSCNWVRSYDKPIDVYVDFVKLDSIEYRSSGDITGEGVLVFDTLKIDVLEGSGKIELEVVATVVFCGLTYGTADIVLKGSSEVSYLYSAGFGLVDTRNLSSKFVFVNNKSSNNLYLRATVELGATIENIGNIYYAGNPPDILLVKKGAGELIKLDN